ncbi:hypothetical protein OH77DRAFT_1439627 [Trametes cingulata]|nr:hypothetical protein OH77DRAFT_1439627 [Trametes cingulata]
MPPFCESLLHIKRLPGELIDRIVDFLHDDWRALVSCALTGPACLLVPSSEFHLSNTIELPISGSQAELLEFVKTFHPNSPLVPLIRSIHVHGPRGSVPAATFPALIDLSHLCYLRSVTLSDMFIESNGHLLRFLCRLPALEDLACVGLVTKPTLPGGIRLVHGDLEVRNSEAAGFATRLKTIRLIDSNLLADTPSPYRSLLGLFVKWLTALGAHDRLEHVEMTVYEPSGEVETHDDLDGEDVTLPKFVHAASQWTALRSLHLRYYPWLDQPPDVSSSATIVEFLRVLLRMLLESPRRARYAELESFTLVLTIPTDTHANADSFAVLAQSLHPSLWPYLVRIRIIIESLATADRARTAPRSGGQLSRSALADAELTDFAEVVRRAFSQVVDGDHERTVEVLVQMW